jgi:DNA adenine methylase
MIRYPGGKGKVKQTIYDALLERRKHLSEYAEFREPFLGGGAITRFCINQRLTNSVWLNDYDPAIASIWHCAIQCPEELIQRIENYTPQVEDFYRFKTILANVRESNLSQLDMAFYKIVVHQFSFSGLGVKAGSPIGGKTQVDNDGNKKKYAFDCRWSPKNITKEIRLFNKSLWGFNVHQNTCTSLDYREVIADPREAIICLDPPYYEQGEALYQFYFTEEQHVEMAQMLQETPHEWVLSYDNHPRILELYSWAEIKPLDIHYSITGSNPSSEILITKRNQSATMRVVSKD